MGGKCQRCPIVCHERLVNDVRHHDGAGLQVVDLLAAKPRTDTAQAYDLAYAGLASHGCMGRRKACHRG